MERESFEDEEVAELLNKYFVAIKVDKEERPDVDNIYMTVCQALTGSGGWPLTIIMTPDKKPFYAGTYFPKKSKYGRPGIMEVLYSVEEAWTERKEELINSSEDIIKAIQTESFENEEEGLNRDTLIRGYEDFRNSFDPVFGGVGEAPKFPIPHNLMYLLRYHYCFKETKALEIVEKTLEGMYKGGIFDHIGFGFSRYSVDRKWLVPHFEKMLYDNALLAITYTEAYQATPKQIYREIAEKIFTYILRDMTSPEGGFYCAEDADSEGVEGKFYVWDLEELNKVLGEEDSRMFSRYYNITAKGNFEGKNIPNLISVELNELEEDEALSKRLDNIREKLFEYREQRIHPHKDDKILTSWNGLMIAALAYGGRVYNNETYIDAAVKAAEFILNKLVRPDGRLLARYREGEAAYPGYLDDYAFFIWGLIELYENTLEVKYIKNALKLNKDMAKYFWDEKNKGFFLYGSDSEELIIRPKDIYDGAIPSGNSVAALNMLRLAQITEDDTLKEMAESIFNAFSKTIDSYPAGYSMCLMALMFDIIGAKEIVLAGSRNDAKTKEFINIINERYLPLSTVVLNTEQEDVKEMLPKAYEKKIFEGDAAAYICENFTCGVPLTETQELIMGLKNN